MFGQFDWDNADFISFCKKNNIQKKGQKNCGKNENYFWFNASKSQSAQANDFAHHFLRHIRNAFAHGQIEVSYKRKAKCKYYILKDFNSHGKQSMGGYIRSDLLWQMIWLLYKTQKKDV